MVTNLAVARSSSQVRVSDMPASSHASLWSRAGGSETLNWEDAARLVDKGSEQVSKYRESPKASTKMPVIIRAAQTCNWTLTFYKISLSDELHPSQITEVYSKTGPIKRSVY